jgi:hypothetical protein
MFQHIVPASLCAWQTHSVTCTAAAAAAAAAALQVTGRLLQVLRVALAVPPGARSRRTVCGTNSSVMHPRVGQILHSCISFHASCALTPTLSVKESTPRCTARKCSLGFELHCVDPMSLTWVSMLGCPGRIVGLCRHVRCLSTCSCSCCCCCCCCCCCRRVVAHRPPAHPVV